MSDERIAIIIATAERLARRMGGVFVPSPQKVRDFKAAADRRAEHGR